ncbi:hypothetical protein PTI98_005744 [Pleurotus ostreatus]|nr:hypothetical protein PTI98_005744 [Pleurotus ostreatus]
MSVNDVLLRPIFDQASNGEIEPTVATCQWAESPQQCFRSMEILQEFKLNQYYWVDFQSEGEVQSKLLLSLYPWDASQLLHQNKPTGTRSQNSNLKEVYSPARDRPLALARDALIPFLHGPSISPWSLNSNTADRQYKLWGRSPTSPSSDLHSRKRSKATHMTPGPRSSVPKSIQLQKS